MGRLAEAAQARRAATDEAVRDETQVGKLLASLNDEDRTDLLSLLADRKGWPSPELAPFIAAEFPEHASIHRDTIGKWRREKMERYL